MENHKEVGNVKIMNSVVSLESTHSLIQSYTKSESLRTVGNVPKSIMKEFGLPANNKPMGDSPDRRMVKDALKDYLELSKEATAKMQKKAQESQEMTLDDIKELDIPDKDKQQLLLLARMIKKITGKELHIILPRDIVTKPIDVKLQLPVTPVKQAQSTPGPDWAVQFKSSESYYESETLSFQSNGVIQTADGKQIQFSVSLNMSRQFAIESNFDLTLGNKALLDPLVINFDGPAARVTKTKFEFDLDSDGKTDQLATLAKGSGFLALDKNGDGVINDGNELFGTKSGNGFADLAAYDSDHNNWIDENDAIFDKLRIWTVNEDGSKELFSLGQKGVGAIYLGNVGAQFSLGQTRFTADAQSTKAGIFVKENGTVGTVQQIDYLV